MKVMNLTPHTINFYRAEDVEVTQKGPYTSYTVKAGATAVRSFPSMGVARAEETISIKFVGYDELGGIKIKCKHGLGAPIGLPESLNADELVLVTKDVYDAAVAHEYPFISQLTVVPGK